MKKNLKIILQKSYLEVCELNPRLKNKFSLELKIKGKNSIFDSVDVITFFSILDKLLKKNKIKIPNLLDENFFLKYKSIKIKDLLVFLNEQKK